ncbi:hypothetical protein SPFM1_00258 [Salmonella phage SPFM1]|nr:hypothetical protein SPFM1_00258 [Salmonella phage SPFM1]
MNVDNVPPGEILRKGLEALKIIPHAEFDGAYGDLEKNLALFRVEDISEIDLLTMYAVGLSFVFMNLPAEPDLTVVQQSLDDERQERIVTYLRLFPENPSATVMENFLAAESLESQKRNGDYGDENLHFEDLITVVSPRVLGIVSSGETPEYILENMCRYVRILHGVLEAFEEFEDSDALYNRLGIGLNPQIVFQKPKETVPADETVRLESIIVKVAVGLGGMDYGYDVALSDVYSNPLSDVLTVNRHEGRAAPMLDLVTL